MRFSVQLFPYDRWSGVDAIVDTMSEADRLGFYAIAFPEHLVMPAIDDVTPISVVWYDNFVLGSALAAATRQIRLLFNVCVVPYRHPVELAKLVATLDVVSQGRVILGAGTGWMRREFDILGVPYRERGPRTDDALRAMKVLWTADQPSYEGTHFSIPPVQFFPRCVQRPHVPIWVGGNGPRPLRRAVELGDGWSPVAGTLEEVADAIAELCDRLAAAGRDPDAFTFSHLLPFGPPDPVAQAASTHVAHGRRTTEPATMGVDEAVDVIGRCRAVGINHLLLQFRWEDASQFQETLHQFVSDVLGQVST